MFLTLKSPFSHCPPRLPTSEETDLLQADFRERFLASLGDIGQFLREERAALANKEGDNDDEEEDEEESEAKEAKDETKEGLFDQCNSELRRDLEVRLNRS